MSGNLIELRHRIRSVRNTQKITRAMKTVSAAKLRKTVVELNKARPYLARVERILRRLTGHVNPARFPLMQARDEGDQVLVVLTADKGLCGAFNSHLIHRLTEFRAECLREERPLKLVTVGNRGYSHCRNAEIEVEKNFPGMMARTRHEDARELTEYLTRLFLDSPVRDISFLYTAFQSTSRQEVTVRSLFPIRCQWDSGDAEEGEEEEREIIYEPSATDIFAATLPYFLESRIYHLLIESQASEHAARMLAMDLASRNASDMIQSLTLTLNKLRQASITNELLEIITATEALQSR